MATGLENLKIYNMAKELELKIHAVTKNFPPEEKYRSVDQLNRSAAATSNNIVEAYHKTSLVQKIYILRDIAISEAEETKRNIERSAEKKLLSRFEAEQISNDYTQLIKSTYGYIRFLKNDQKTKKPINRCSSTTLSPEIKKS